jgi:hypothetical protein
MPGPHPDPWLSTGGERGLTRYDAPRRLISRKPNASYHDQPQKFDRRTKDIEEENDLCLSGQIRSESKPIHVDQLPGPLDGSLKWL